MRAELVLRGARYLCAFDRAFHTGDIGVSGGRFLGVGPYEGETELDCAGKTVVPGFIDGHIHLESTMLAPPNFARAAAPRGTSAVIADPHEIANVCGMAGVDYLFEATRDLPLDVFFAAPSCVPATRFDESGARLDVDEVARLLNRDRVVALGEMMDYPGVIAGDKSDQAKIDAALLRQKRVDGHAPLVSGLPLNQYLASGVSTDHECSRADEAVEKLEAGAWILIREGSACKNLRALMPLITERYISRCLFATDDRHPGDLAREGHIDHIVRSAIAMGADPALCYTAASYNAAVCYGLDRRGAIAPGYLADFVILKDIQSVDIESVYRRGKPIDLRRTPCADDAAVRGSVKRGSVSASDFKAKRPLEKVIGLVPGEILTRDLGWAAGVDPARGIVKAALCERHGGSGAIGVAYLSGYGLARGAVATTVSHDAHNIVAAGATDEEIAFAVNRVIQMGGGMAAVEGEAVLAELALPIAGLMCDLDAESAGAAIERLNAAARFLGVSEGVDPFMTLSFVPLPVIPELRLTARGVVDVRKFEIV